MNDMLEHDQEAEPGIPEAMPADERILWQGQSGFASLAQGTFHARKLAVYFVALIAFQQIVTLQGGASFAEALPSGAGFTLLALAALGILLLYSWRCSKATMFTVTTRRVIMRAGIAVPVTLNLPFSRIQSVDLRMHGDGTGDIAILPEPTSRVSYLLLWPLVKPWRMMRVRPVLRGINDASTVAAMLGEALAADIDAARERERKAAQVRANSPQPAAAEERPGRRWAPYPTIPLTAAVSLVVIAIVGVGSYQLLNVDAQSGSSAATVINQVDLFFEDRSDGSVVVIDATDGQAIDVLEAGTNGFVRSTLRTFVRERKAFNVGNEQPFRLQRIENGQLLLQDSATGREVDLWAFGQTNAKAFGRFLFRETARKDTSVYSIDEAETTAAALTSQETRQ